MLAQILFVIVYWVPAPLCSDLPLELHTLHRDWHDNSEGAAPAKIAFGGLSWGALAHFAVLLGQEQEQGQGRLRVAGLPGGDCVVLVRGRVRGGWRRPAWRTRVY